MSLTCRGFILVCNAQVAFEFETSFLLVRRVVHLFGKLTADLLQVLGGGLCMLLLGIDLFLKRGDGGLQKTCGVNFFILDSRRVWAPAPKVL